MKKILLFLAISFSSQLFANSIPHLYLIKKGNSEAYILGSIHIGFSVYRDYSKKQRDFLFSFENFVFEADPNKLQKSDTLLPIEHRNEDFLSEESWTELKEILMPRIPEQIIQRLLPNIISQIIGTIEFQKFQKIMEEKFPEIFKDPTAPMDLEIKEKAEQLKKQINFLERGYDSLALFRDSAITRLELENLDEHLKINDNDEILLERMIQNTNFVLMAQLEAYKKLTGPEFMAIISKTYTRKSLDQVMIDHMNELTYIRRNHKWIKPIKKNITISQSLIVVGAGHLYGKEGVINLLRKEGYTIEQVSILPVRKKK